MDFESPKWGWFASFLVKSVVELLKYARSAQRTTTFQFIKWQRYVKFWSCLHILILDEEDNNATEAGCFTGDASTLEVGCVTKDGPPKKKVCYCSESNCNTKAFLNGGVSTKAKFASIALAVAMIFFVL